MRTVQYPLFVGALPIFLHRVFISREVPFSQLIPGAFQCNHLKLPLSSVLIPSE